MELISTLFTVFKESLSAFMAENPGLLSIVDGVIAAVGDVLTYLETNDLSGGIIDSVFEFVLNLLAGNK